MLHKGDEQRIEAMVPAIKKALLQLSARIAEEVPTDGEFKKIFEFFYDESQKLEIISWSLSVYAMPPKIAATNKRFIDLAGYLPGGYKVSTIEASGTNAECQQFISDPSALSQILNGMYSYLSFCYD